MAWHQGQSYSADLRARVLAAVDGGMAARLVKHLISGGAHVRRSRRRGNEILSASITGCSVDNVLVAALASRLASRSDGAYCRHKQRFSSGPPAPADCAAAKSGYRRAPSVPLFLRKVG